MTDGESTAELERRGRELRASIPWILKGRHADTPEIAMLDVINIELASRSRPPIEPLPAIILPARGRYPQRPQDYL